MNTKHIPGPWKVTSAGHIEADGVTIGELWQTDHMSADVFEANAALITAAPDLLDALKELMAQLDDPSTMRATKANALAAIAKAEGR